MATTIQGNILAAHEIKGVNNIIRFFTGGKATVTFLNTVTGNHFTFYSYYPDKKNPILLRIYAHSDYLGYLVKKQNGYWHFMKGKSTNDNLDSYKAFIAIWKILCSGTIAGNLKAYHQGVCGVCKRPLTDPESISLGIGPDCRKKLL